MSNRDIFAELVEGFESLAAEREGEKKHFWLVYYSHKDRGVHTEGHLVLSTKHSYFNQANMKHVMGDVPVGALIVSVNHLGEMTEEEWRGEE